MKIYCRENYEEMSRLAADIISSQIILKPDCVLGLATGSTPVGCYERLVQKYREKDLDFSQVTTVNLDEYKGLSGINKQSYRWFMNHNLFDQVNIDKMKTFVPDGMEKDIKKACDNYEEIIRKTGGIDLQLLGLGHNGHIGFNEPGEFFWKDTHCVELTENTIAANQRFFHPGETVPARAYTMGIGTIMRARKILLIVSGEDKADIVEKAFSGEVTPKIPASVLQLHTDVTLVGDKAALGRLLNNRQ